MKLIPFSIAILVFFSTQVYALSERIHCEGHFTAVLNDAESSASFSGDYIWDILQGDASYVSLEGELLQPPKKYLVQRTIKLKAKLINKEDSIYELTPLQTTVESEDNLPKSVAEKSLFRGPRIYRIQKTLVSSYLISKPSSPIFICHDID